MSKPPCASVKDSLAIAGECFRYWIRAGHSNGQFDKELIQTVIKLKDPVAH
jgi:hypothetical protein